MNFDEQISKISKRHVEISEQLAEVKLSVDERMRLSKEYAELSPIINAANELGKVRDEIIDLARLLKDPESEDEFRELAESELVVLKGREPRLERQIQLLLLPRDRDDDKNVIIEVPCGHRGWRSCPVCFGSIPHVPEICRDSSMAF